MSNYTPLQRNTLDGLSEAAGCLYLKLCDQYQAHASSMNERRAFYEADRFERQCAGVLDYILTNGPVGLDGSIGSETRSALSAFFAERWRNNFMGREVRP